MRRALSKEDIELIKAALQPYFDKIDKIDVKIDRIEGQLRHDIGLGIEASFR